MTTDYLYLEQQEIELESVIRGVERYKQSRLARNPSESGPELRLIGLNMDKMVEAVADLQIMAATGQKARGIWFWAEPMLSIAPERIAMLTLGEMFNHNGQGAVSIAFSIARAVEYEEKSTRLRKSDPDHHAHLMKAKRLTPSGLAAARHKAGQSGEVWTKQQRMWLGTILHETACRVTELFDRGLHRDPHVKHSKTCIYLKPSVAEYLEKCHEEMSLLSPMNLPMVCPPVDWTDTHTGGYLRSKNKSTTTVPIVKVKPFQAKQEWDFADLGSVPAVINAMQQTRWRINPKVLDVAMQIHRNGGGMAGMVNLRHRDLPVRPEDIDWNPESKKKWKGEARLVHEENHRLISKRTSTLSVLDQSRRFSKYPAIYFVWQCDWRSRLYPVGTVLHPQGDDLSRALLEFADARPLGEDGFKWLTIHLGNCIGWDKLPYRHRIERVHAESGTIHGWARDPFANKGWMDTDEPFKCLAAATEWSMAVRCSDPSAFLSRIPVSLDGKCNGLQHLSALGRDSCGADAVCLLPVDVPNDIYGQVAERIRSWVHDDAAKGLAVAQRWKETVDWDGPDPRAKLAKRATMTTPYSVTPQGVRSHLIEDGFPQLLSGDLNENANYMRDVVVDAVSEVVKEAVRIMDWLRDCATVARQQGQGVRFRTPLGFLVDQEYIKSTHRTLTTIIQKYRYWIPDKQRRLLPRKQLQGISPNFIHSLDASHLGKLVLKLKEDGVRDFLMVHDSFGVHACHAELLSKRARETFVDLHSAPLLENFKAELESQLGVPLPPVPEKGTMNILDVLDAEYMVS